MTSGANQLTKLTATRRQCRWPACGVARSSYEVDTPSDTWSRTAVFTFEQLSFDIERHRLGGARHLGRPEASSVSAKVTVPPTAPSWTRRSPGRISADGVRAVRPSPRRLPQGAAGHEGLCMSAHSFEPFAHRARGAANTGVEEAHTDD